ncbi:MAG: hypothetical protein WDN27_06740 [Candidatus Saccharibacteria bacterium]
MKPLEDTLSFIWPRTAFISFPGRPCTAQHFSTVSVPSSFWKCSSTTTSDRAKLTARTVQGMQRLDAAILSPHANIKVARLEVGTVRAAGEFTVHFIHRDQYSMSYFLAAGAPKSPLAILIT